jgi:hypothetical protein
MNTAILNVLGICMGNDVRCSIVKSMVSDGQDIVKKQNSYKTVIGKPKGKRSFGMHGKSYYNRF